MEPPQPASQDGQRPPPTRAERLAAAPAHGPSTPAPSIGQREMRLENPAHGLAATFSDEAVEVSLTREPGLSLSLSAAGLGCEGDARPLEPAAPRAWQDQIEYQRRAGSIPLVERYVNGSLGLEQGFTLPEPPACARERQGRVIMEIAIDGRGRLAHAIERAGSTVTLRDHAGHLRLALAAPYAEDAYGRRLPARFAPTDDGHVAVHVDTRHARYPIILQSRITTQRVTLMTEDVPPGAAVSVHAHTLLAADGGAGRVHVFERESGLSFIASAMLAPDTPAPGFGAAVSLWADTAVVGAPGDGQPGQVLVFERVDDIWLERARLTAGGVLDDGFGSAVHLSGDTLIVGAPRAHGGLASSGAAYVFTRTLGAWTMTAKLTPGAPRAGAGFGTAVTIWRDLAVVGAPADHGAAPRSGAAHVFTRGPGGWAFSARLAPRDGAPGDGLGTALALADRTLILGAPGHGPRGAAYVYAHDGMGWIVQDRLAPPELAAVAGFGADVALWDSVAVVSAGAPAPGQPHSVYTFERSAQGFGLIQHITAEHDQGGAGPAIALTGSTLVIGAAQDSAPGAGMLQAYDLATSSTELACADADTLSSLVACIRGNMPRSGSSGFVVPTHAQQQDWRNVVADMLSGVCSASLPASLTGVMRRRVFVDAGNGRSYCVLQEVLDANGDGIVDRGWGTFIVNADATRELSHQAPHPRFEALTAVQAVELFKATDSRTFLMCGAHRHANNTDSACDGRYNESDCAHATANMYYPTVLELDDYYGPVEHTQIQWHGMADATCPDINVYISPGLSSTPPLGSNTLELKLNIEHHLPSWNVSVPGTGVCSLNGRHNIEGRYLNGVPDGLVCTTEATLPTNKFVHIEQERDVRDAASWVQPIIETWPASGSPPPPPPPPPPVLPPADLSVTCGKQRCTLSWSAPAGAASYRVYRSGTSGGPYTTSGTTTTTSFVDKQLTRKTTYHWVVTTVSAGGESVPSSEVSGTTI